MSDIVKFETGKTYYARCLGDNDLIYAYVVYKRTEKSVWLKDKFGKDMGRKKIDTDTYRDGLGNTVHEEIVHPEGRYSLAPMIGATRWVDDGENSLYDRIEHKEQAEHEKYETEMSRRREAKRRETVMQSMIDNFNAMKAMC